VCWPFDCIVEWAQCVVSVAIAAVFGVFHTPVIARAAHVEYTDVVFTHVLIAQSSRF